MNVQATEVGVCSKVQIFNLHPELENPGLCGIHRLAARSNLIPAQKVGVFYKNKEESDFLYSLNGDYQFHYRQTDDIPEFYQSEFSDGNWDMIDVPSMWQFRGYGKCTYTNTQYPFPFDPPYICCDNPVGYYRKKFYYEPNERTILHFGGVDNAFYVYLNGEFVGFSKGSRIPAEFDVTNLIHHGENVLAVKVFTYSDASYLEGQDMLMANGIFRDVYLIGTKKTHLWDYRVTSDLKGFHIALDMSESNPAYSIKIQINDIVRDFPCEKKIETYIAIDNPKLWNSEEPNLYSLTISVLEGDEITEIHSKKIGMMHSCFTPTSFLVNGKPVYIKGINRHEYDCNNGRAVSVDLIEKELNLIKENNINAIRCAHYTNHPAFYEICTELGIFVMDEYDIETHGCTVAGDQGFLSKKEEWLPAFLDRTERALIQNKNETCIYMRSVGNEFGRGDNIIKCLEYTMAYDPDHAAIHDQDESGTDWSLPGGEYDFVRRFGYASAKKLNSVIAGEPLCMQVEYAHAMGNGPGYLEQYQELVYHHDNYLGGFVWEFKNHGFHQVDENGKDYYLYGGDFGEPYHWYNFCLDGFLMSDGTPKHSWYELGEVFSPVYTQFKNEVLTLKNTYNFRNLSSLHMEWTICEDYIPLRCGTMQLPNVEPHGEIILPINTMIKNPTPGATYYLNLKFLDGEKIVGNRQYELPTKLEKKSYHESKFNGEISVEENTITIKNTSFLVSFKNGMVTRFVKDGKELLTEGATFNLFRASTDNDGILGMVENFFHRHAIKWKEQGIQTCSFFMYEMNAEVCEDKAICQAKGKVLPTSKFYGFDVTIRYEIFEDGLILVDIQGIPYGKFPEVLPRIGLCLPLAKEMENVSWYGRGDRENYSDCKLASPMGLYKKKVWESYTIYDMPQETGNHENSRYVQVTDNNDNGLCIIGLDEFSFSYHDFTLANLDLAKHKNEIEKSDKNYLYVDYKMRGLGSHSCGPEPEEEFELRPHSFEFAFLLTNAMDNDSALSLARTDFGVHSHSLDGNNLDENRKVEYQLL